MDLQSLANDLKAAGQLTDFLALVSDAPALFNCSTEKVFPDNDFGNIYRRQMLIPKAGTAFEGHTHNFDHMTYLIRGKVVRQIRTSPDADPVEDIFEAPSAMLIKAGCYHKFTALSDDVIAECVYSLRNFATGEYTTSWDGDLRPVT